MCGAVHSLCQMSDWCGNWLSTRKTYFFDKIIFSFIIGKYRVVDPNVMRSQISAWRYER